MRDNECILIYESIYNGNTVKIAKAIARTLGCKIVTASDALETDLSIYKTILLGSGIYFGNLHPSIIKIAEKLDNSPQRIFIFSSRGNPMHGRYHSSLRNILSRKGKSIAGEFTVRGYDGTGPFLIFGGGSCGRPHEKDIERAVKYVRTIFPEYCVKDYYKTVVNKIPVKDGITNTYKIADNNNNNTIVIKGDIVSVNQNLCIGCQKCVTVCPMNILSVQNGKALPVNELDCTLCRLCSDNCKERAIYIHYTWRDAINVAKRHSGRTTL